MTNGSFSLGSIPDSRLTKGSSLKQKVANRKKHKTEVATPVKLTSLIIKIILQTLIMIRKEGILSPKIPT